MSGFADIGLLERIAREVAPGGPDLTAAQIAEVVAELRQASETSVDLVLDRMRLPAEWADATRRRASAGSVLVVDRPTWIKATGQSLSAMLEPVLTDSAREAFASARTATTLELAAVLGVLSARVLGQFDPYGGEGSGRLLLVAPTIARTETALEVPARDFRLWVALHETAHRMQFSAAPWLRGHLQELAAGLVSEQSTGPGATALLRRLPQVLRGDAEMLDLVTQPDQRERLDRMIALMSLLEGHADVVMDSVGRRVIPSLPSIRRKFERRRDAGLGPGGVVGRLLGTDAKLRQYREGAAFVRAVVRRVGHSGLSTVFAAPENLPSSAEIAAPTLWVERVHGLGESAPAESERHGPERE